MRLKNLLALFFLLTWLSIKVIGNDTTLAYKKILYLNSYAITYSWGDSVTSGVVNSFRNKENIILFVEHLDTKRFGKEFFENYYDLFIEKYRKTKFDVVITSDNNALDFILQYGNSLAPGVPVIFCGINNPGDYNFENTKYYGIKEGVDLNSVVQLAISVIPGIKKLYFIGDSTSTSLVNLNYARSIEPKYKNTVEFMYITNVSIDSLHKLVQHLEPGNAIPLHDIFQDIDGQPVNSDLVMEKTSRLATVPIFMDSETSFGRGIIGGILNSGSSHGREAAKLAMKFLDSPDFVPVNRVDKPKDNYYFDYNIVTKYKIDPRLLPKSATIINQPKKVLIKYFKIILLAVGIFAGLLIVISILIINNKKRKKAENELNQKLIEIQQQNLKLEDANYMVNSMNEKLEKVNENLINTNKELAKAKNKSEESDRLKSAFLANMSHEIRTPLNAIVGFSALFKEDDIDKGERNRFAELIEVNSETLLNLIDDILDISKTEAGQLKINQTYISIKKLLNELLESFGKNLKNPELSVTISEKCMNVDFFLFTDQLRLNQIFSNLISNAIKFTTRGRVEIGFEKTQNEFITFYVKDTGKGIDNKDIEKVFDRFWKTDEEEGSFNPGTGLGLSISQKLCELLGGKIWVESKKGTGSVFYFTHPADIRHNVKEDVSEVPAINHNYDQLKGLKIALVEDEINNIEFLSKALDKYNALISKFYNGKQIVDYVVEQRNKPDLILMDLKMPLMNGYDAATKIKSEYPEIIIIAQTAYALEEDISKIKSAKFDQYITKPIKPETLINVILKSINNIKFD